MSIPITLSEYLKSLPKASTVKNKTVLIIDTSGNLEITTQLAPTTTTQSCLNANEAPPGWSKTHAATTNLPISGNGGFLLTMDYDGYALIQKFYQYEAGGPKEWIRRRLSGSTISEWQEWKQLAFVTT